MRSAARRRRTINTMPLYVILIVLFIIYFVFQKLPEVAVVFGAIIFFLIIAILIIEVSNGFEEEGFKKNIMEIGAAIIVVIVLWYALRAVLNTSYPLDVVPSCSMLPNLNRGDMILIQGVNKNSIGAPIVNVTQDQWNSSFSNLNTEALQCVAYSNNTGTAKLSQFVKPGYNIGLLKSTQYGARIVTNASQSNNIVRYACGAVNVKLQNGTVVSEASTVAITIANTTITGDRNNSIIVYQTVPQDQFYKYGDSYIVHRVYALLNVSGVYYVLTKGDNNPGLDIQYLNTPANLSQIGGKVIGSLPFIGYVKLILSNNFVEPTGCNYTTQN